MLAASQIVLTITMLPHQALGLVVLAIAVVHAQRLAREPTEVGVAAHHAGMRRWGRAA